MTWERAIKILFSAPMAILKSGIQAQNEALYLRQINQEYQCSSLPVVDIHQLSNPINETLECYSFLDGTSMISDMVLLQILAKRFDKCDYLELGSWRGESLRNVSSHTESSTSMTLGTEELKSMGISDRSIELHGVFSKKLKHTRIIHANTMTYDFANLNQQFDLIFIDADHQYTAVVNDTKKAIDVLKNDKSIIVWHDYAYSPEKIRPSVMKAILDSVTSDMRKHIYHISNTMCAVYIPELFDSEELIEPMIPNKNFIIKVISEEFVAHEL